MNRHKFNRTFLRILGIDAVLVLKMIPALRLPAGGRNLSWSSTVLKMMPALRLPADERNLSRSSTVLKLMPAMRLSGGRITYLSLAQC